VHVGQVQAISAAEEAEAELAVVNEDVASFAFWPLNEEKVEQGVGKLGLINCVESGPKKSNEGVVWIGSKGTISSNVKSLNCSSTADSVSPRYERGKSPKEIPRIELDDESLTVESFSSRQPRR